MSFRDEYKEAFRDIVPDKKFVDELSGTLKREQEKKRMPYRKQLVAAFVCLLIVAGVAGYLLGRVPESSQPVQVNTGNTMVDPTSEPNLFGKSKWYQEGDGPEKILRGFLSRLQDGGEQVRVYENKENQFSDDMLLSGEELRELAEQIRTARPSQEKPGNTEKKLYYMAEFPNGDIIKFVISEDGFFYFQDLDTIYKFS